MISFSLNSPYTPVNAFLNAVPTEVRCRNLQKEVDEMWTQLGLPREWRPAEQAMVLLALVADPDWELLQKLHQRLLEAPQKPFEDASERFLLDMERELSRVRPQLLRQKGMSPDLTRLWDRLVPELRGEKLRGGCGNVAHGAIWRDVVPIVLANAIGYLVGAVVQGAMENKLCEDGKLSYWDRFFAELLNRLVQHVIRFALRDVAYPCLQKGAIWPSARPSDSLCWRMTQFFLTSFLLFASDQVGVALLGEFPSVPLDTIHNTPELGMSGAHMLLFAATDGLAWAAAGYVGHFCGTRYEMNDRPLKHADIKLGVHGFQVLADAFALSAWKFGEKGWSPNNDCVPGMKSGANEPPNYHGYAAVLDLIEISLYALVGLIWMECREAQEARNDRRARPVDVGPRSIGLHALPAGEVGGSAQEAGERANLPVERREGNVVVAEVTEVARAEQRANPLVTEMQPQSGT